MKKSNQKNKTGESKESLKQSSENTETVDTETVETADLPKEYGGRKDGLNPTRYGDWEKNGRCIDF